MIGIKVGFGYDVHRFAENRPLVIGGITIPHAKGLSGHSDADVLLHAMADALLGAASLGDIGTVFPDDDPYYKDIASSILLEKAVEMISNRGYKVGNLDATVVLQSPKVSTYIPEMKKKIAGLLKIDEPDISIKAKTSERMGFVGREEGVSAFATVLIFRENVV